MQNNTLSVSEAQQLIKDAISPILDVEQISLGNALDRITSENIIAPMHVPAFDNSAMDGYAFCAQDVASTPTLLIVGTAFAGRPFIGAVKAGQAVRITTGAKMPERCDCVLPQEFATLMNDDTLDMSNISVHTGQNRRCRGEDLAQGDVAIPKGCRLGPAELGVLASLGIEQIRVQRRLRVALFSTGDELHSAGQQLNDGGIFDSNRVVLHSLLTRFGAEVIDLGVQADDPATLLAALKNIAPQVDVIITSGGIAGGAADYTRDVMQKLGELQFLSIAMRPGRQLALGKIHDTYLFGLPGNPVAVMVSFYFFVRPALQLLSGAKITMPLRATAIAQQRIPKKIGRTEFLRGICAVSEQGVMEVRATGAQGSGILTSMSQANCIVIVNQDKADVEVGDAVDLMMFDGLNFV